MAHLNPLEKEFLIRQFKQNGRIKLSDFCDLHNVSNTAFRKWLKQYEEGGIEGLARADAEIKEESPRHFGRRSRWCCYGSCLCIRAVRTVFPG